MADDRQARATARQDSFTESGSAASAHRQRAATGSRSLREVAYDEIKRRIITCAFKPGEALSEAGIGAALEIGRTPVHQALDRLMVDGLVEVLPRKGVIVRPLSLDELYDIIDVRRVLECHCVELAARNARKDELAELDDILHLSKEAARHRDIEELMQLDRQFHAVLAHASRNAVLIELLGKLHDRSLRFWFVSLRASDHHWRVIDQHARIVEAVRNGDGAAAKGAMSTHIEAFQSNVTRQL